MKAIADVCIIPIGVGVSLSAQIAVCERVLASAGLKTELHANGTNVEGEWDSVMAAVRRCHEALHDMGVPRVHTEIRIGTRSDRAQSMEDKLASVKEKLR
jgi:uncharacterized protein (TIGR00106 family)